MSAILFVGDDPGDRDFVRGALDGSPLTLHAAGSPSEAVGLAGGLRPHLVILAARGARGDVAGDCRSLREEAALAGVPILLLVEGEDSAPALLGLGSGAEDCVARTSPLEVVRNRVSRLVRARQMARVASLNTHFVQLGRLLVGVVHEIRGPLAVIRGSAELARAQLGEPEPAREWVEPIIRNAQLLQVRLEHLMAWVRGNPSALREVELPPLVREASELFVKGSDPRRDRLRVEAELDAGLPRVRADGGRLMQALLCLFGNASEAALEAEGAGRIRVRGASVREGGRDWVRLDVEDSGPGIPEELLPRVFEPFFTTKAGGSGFGLYLASENLREQGGRLSACNLPGGGACFSLWLVPAGEGPPAGTQAVEGAGIA